ncbi:hypothetical protein ACQUY5_18745 [Bacillus cereus]|uniref:hypothetical protein n=1 Tax=Bacillus cereus TaxID=1396 RepID=UPI003D183A75
MSSNIITMMSPIIAHQVSKSLNSMSEDEDTKIREDKEALKLEKEKQEKERVRKEVQEEIRKLDRIKKELGDKGNFRFEVFQEISELQNFKSKESPVVGYTKDGYFVGITYTEKGLISLLKHSKTAGVILLGGNFYKTLAFCMLTQRTYEPTHTHDTVSNFKVSPYRHVIYHDFECLKHEVGDIDYGLVDKTILDSNWRFVNYLNENLGKVLNNPIIRLHIETNCARCPYLIIFAKNVQYNISKSQMSVETPFGLLNVHGLGKDVTLESIDKYFYKSLGVEKGVLKQIIQNSYNQ